MSIAPFTVAMYLHSSTTYMHIHVCCIQCIYIHNDGDKTILPNVLLEYYIKTTVNVIKVVYCFKCIFVLKATPSFYKLCHSYLPNVATCFTKIVAHR